MKLEEVQRILKVVQMVEKYRVLPTKQEGSCIIGDEIYTMIGLQKLVLASPSLQGSFSREEELNSLLPHFIELLPEYKIEISYGWLD